VSTNAIVANENCPHAVRQQSVSDRSGIARNKTKNHKAVCDTSEERGPPPQGKEEKCNKMSKGNAQ